MVLRQVQREHRAFIHCTPDAKGCANLQTFAILPGRALSAQSCRQVISPFAVAQDRSGGHANRGK
jgi:hypothetical protein